VLHEQAHGPFQQVIKVERVRTTHGTMRPVGTTTAEADFTEQEKP
jgi:hypothetical protein